MRVICVDDEQPVLDNFKMKVRDLYGIKSLHLFLDGSSALEWAAKNPVDTAFLDMEMPGMNGIELAKKLKEIDRNIRIIFVTAYAQYALEAFGVDALGYILKPYTSEEIQQALEKASLMRSRPRKRVKIQTIPEFSVWLDGRLLVLGRTKVEELFALLVDRGNVGLTVREAIDCLWPGRLNDESTQSLYRMTMKRLMDTLKEYGIDDIIETEGRKKYIRTELVECDLYRILAGNEEEISNYTGDYMKEYTWGEARNAQLNGIKAAHRQSRVTEGIV